jgi:adenylate cyclase
MTAQQLGRRQKAALLALVCLLAWVAAQWSPLREFDRSIQDRLIRLLPAQSVQEPLVLVDIDERSLQLLGPWPWPRSLVAELSSKLKQAGASHQAWDLFFAEPQRDDAALLAQVRSLGKSITLGQVLVLDPTVSNPPQSGERQAWPDLAVDARYCADGVRVFGHLGIAKTLSEGAHLGHLSATPDLDGRLRRLPAVVCQDGKAYPQFALATALGVNAIHQLSVSEGSGFLDAHHWLSVGSYRFPLDAQGWLTIPYWRAHGQWASISAVDLLMGKVPDSLVQGRIALVGSSAVGLGDAVATPYHPNAPGLSVHAELLDAAATHRWRFEPVGAVWASTALAILAASLALVVVRKPRRWPGLLLLLIALLATPFAAGILSAAQGRFIPVLPPFAALTFGAIFFLLLQIDQQRRQARRLAQHLESFLPRSLALEVAHQSPNGEAFGRPGEGVVLALQVRGLDRWIGAVDSLRALAFIHGLLTVVDRILLPHRGHLEQRQGELVFITLPAQTDVSRLFVSLEHALEPLLAANESPQYPLALQIAAEEGPYLLAIAGSQASRRPLLLGPVVDTVQAMVSLAQELAAPVLIGPVLANQWARAGRTDMVELGHFVLPEQPEAKPLFRWQPAKQGV